MSGRRRIMEINLDLLKKLIHGAVVTEKDGEFHFSRFTGEQRGVYSGNSDFFRKTFASSSVRMEFDTDAENIVIDTVAARGSSRKFYYFDIVVNGKLIHTAGAGSFEEQPEFHLELPLDGKIKRVCIYFPCLAEIRLKRAAFEGGSLIAPVRRKYRMLSFGDSITQGYDAVHPSLTYINQIADMLDSDVFNKAVGGDFFNPALAACPEPEKPDFITVAYGTNDWAKCTRSQLENNASQFFRNIARNYPGIPVLTILPIWRKNSEQVTAAGSFSGMHEIIRRICAEYPAVRIVDGMTLVPHLDQCFQSDGLHPNDAGFMFMAENLQKYLPEL